MICTVCTVTVCIIYSTHNQKEKHRKIIQTIMEYKHKKHTEDNKAHTHRKHRHSGGDGYIEERQVTGRKEHWLMH